MNERVIAIKTTQESVKLFHKQYFGFNFQKLLVRPTQKHQTTKFPKGLTLEMNKSFSYNKKLVYLSGKRLRSVQNMK